MGFKEWWGEKQSRWGLKFSQQPWLERAWNDATAAQRKPQLCGHPTACVVSTDERTGYCGWCADVARLREGLELIPVQLSDSPDGGTPPPEVQGGEWCLVRYRGAWWAGRFVQMRESFWNFHDIYGKPWQYDKPGHNASHWPDTIWRIAALSDKEE